MTTNLLTPTQLEELRRLSTCVVASAIETFQVRLPNIGFSDASVKCVFPDAPSIIGYAVTARIRSSAPPMEGGSYYERCDWWEHISKMSAPPIAVIEDVDEPPGTGAFVGEVHANILKRLGCNGLVTNGAVRDLPQVRALGFQMFAGNVSVSHAYAHIFDFGHTVQVGGLQVNPGDLIQGDLHGVLTIPSEIADRVAPVSEKIRQRRQAVIEICRSAGFSIDKLAAVIRSFGAMNEGYGVNPNSARGKQ